MKQLASIVLALALCICLLTACGGSPSGSDLDSQRQTLTTEWTAMNQDFAKLGTQLQEMVDEGYDVDQDLIDRYNETNGLMSDWASAINNELSTMDESEIATIRSQISETHTWIGASSLILDALM